MPSSAGKVRHQGGKKKRRQCEEPSKKLNRTADEDKKKAGEAHPGRAVSRRAGKRGAVGDAAMRGKLPMLGEKTRHNRFGPERPPICREAHTIQIYHGMPSAFAVCVCVQNIMRPEPCTKRRLEENVRNERTYMHIGTNKKGVKACSKSASTTLHPISCSCTP